MAPTTYRLTWNGPAILERARRGAIAALTEIDQRVEAEAKAELYPGHGLITGMLRRGVVGEAAQVDTPTRVVGRVAVRGVPYARPLERRYGYLAKGYGKVKPRMRDILDRRMQEAIHGGAG